METKTFQFAEAAMRGLSNGDASGTLLGVFARILSRQVSIDTDTGEINLPSGAFDTLLSVFTYVSTPASSHNRPDNGPLGFSRSRLEEVKEQAKNEVDVETPTENPTEEPSDTPYLRELVDGEERQAVMGEDGVQDIFIVPIVEDQYNGAFANIGEAVIQNYQQADGDIVLFVGQQNQWNAISDMSMTRVEPQGGNAKLIFNNDHSQSAPDQHQSLQIEGAEVSSPFGVTPANITNVDLEFATQASIDAAGGFANYVADYFLA